jgi:osmotically-inducible protein OsmY
MNKRDGLVFGILIGAAAMFLLDPARGRRRNRARGTIIEVKARLPHEVIDDEVLERRVRAHLARLVRQPETIHVTAEHGRVTLRGIEPEEGAGELVAHVEEIDGVHDVVNRLKGRQAAP